jgi:hypothetical protein
MRTRTPLAVVILAAVALLGGLAPGPRFGLIVHHTDGEREYAYDRVSHVGKLDKALDDAPKNGWTVVSMKTEWKVIYPFEKK